MRISLLFFCILLFSCQQPGRRKANIQTNSFASNSMGKATADKDTVFRYKEVPHDPAIPRYFRIIYDNYKLYFDPKLVSHYCDSIIRLKDHRKAQYINIKREVNHLTDTLYLDNDEIILKNFRPRIINRETGEEGKSLLLAIYKNYCNEDKAIFFVITPRNDTVRLNRVNYDYCFSYN
jgi:hypothetical protein